MSEHVRVERSGAVLAITLARPERRNAITVAMYAALADAVEGAGERSVRSGSSPSAARARTSPPATTSPTSSTRCRAIDEEIPVWRLLRALANCETPIVAAVHGNCVGIGTTMLLHCDLVIAEDGARFSLPFVDLGLVPEAASSLLFPRLAGRRRAARYLLLGEPFGVDEAMAIGLVSHRAAAGRAGRDAGADSSRRCSPSRPKRCARRSACCATATREEILERMKLEARPVRRAPRLGRGQGSDQRILREAEAGFLAGSSKRQIADGV